MTGDPLVTQMSSLRGVKREGQPEGLSLDSQVHPGGRHPEGNRIAPLALAHGSDYKLTYRYLIKTTTNHTVVGPV